MNPYANLCDDFYVNMNLSTEMELPDSRDRGTVLHFFEQIQKKYPSMRNFYCRDKGDFVLEEDKDRGQYRWCTIELRRVCSGQVNPESVSDALQQHKFVLETAPYALSVSPIDCEALDLLYGFDFTYRGNHNQLAAEALGVSPAFERLLEYPNAQVISYEPSLTLALDEDCRTQCRLSIENRTTAYHVRTGEFPEEQLSVYVTARQYGSLDAGDTFEATLDRLSKLCRDIVDNYVIERVIEPLQKTINYGPSYQDDDFDTEEANSPRNYLWVVQNQNYRGPLLGQRQETLQALAHGTIGTTEQAKHAALDYIAKHPGAPAAERAQVVGLVKMGLDVPSFAHKGEYVWIIRFTSPRTAGGITQELWVNSTTGQVHAVLPLAAAESPKPITAENPKPPRQRKGPRDTTR
jgi:hypothetical protein